MISSISDRLQVKLRVSRNSMPGSTALNKQKKFLHLSRNLSLTGKRQAVCIEPRLSIWVTVIILQTKKMAGNPTILHN
jgi:hypothetical protein